MKTNTMVAVSWTTTDPTLDTFAALEMVYFGNLTRNDKGEPVVEAEGLLFCPDDIGTLSAGQYSDTDDVNGCDIYESLTPEQLSLIADAKAAGYVIDTINNGTECVVGSRGAAVPNN